MFMILENSGKEEEEVACGGACSRKVPRPQRLLSLVVLHTGPGLRGSAPSHPLCQVIALSLAQSNGYKKWETEISESKGILPSWVVCGRSSVTAVTD